MHIAIDATAWGNQRGYGRQARALLSALVKLDQYNHYTFVIDSPDYLTVLPPGLTASLVQSSQPAAQAASASGRRSLVDLWRMSRALSSPGFDLVIFPTVYSYVPVFSRARKIVFIHDAIPEKFPELTFSSRRARRFWQVKHALARRQADVIVTVSEYSKRCLVEALGLDSQKIFVVGEASDLIFRVIDNPLQSLRAFGAKQALADDSIGDCFVNTARNDTGLPVDARNDTGLPVGACNDTGLLRFARNDIKPRWIVYVGGFGPHKNIAMLIEVFASLANRPDYADCRLLLVGEYEQEVFYSTSGELRARIAAGDLAERVLFTGFLPDEELVSLLNLATVLVLPSLMEGFGLPAIEAAACGCPVIATRESPLPELLGAGGLYIDPHKPAELEAALAHVLSSPDLRQEMRLAGLQATRALTWEAAARQLLDIIELLTPDHFLPAL